ncbi:MAG: tRNA (adenosine(37)-N6)-dimethylallyltransferase MiaA [Ruminococcaceae bacterium]|nr:tRNA (adenosine(37)-N6)-dimethylallyltransferase MiaA [Oscillospiraceae bacterium]
MNKIKTISILGPTASGKTGLAIELAKRLDGEIISCDSMQLYREMNIGTATPDMAEREGIPHHMMDIISPEEEFSTADYARLASEAIADVASRGKLPILCGGTGMYHDSLMKITSFGESEANEELREELYEYAQVNGNEALHAVLAEFDPEAAESIHPNNVKRVIRAIEIYKTTGKTKTETDREQVAGDIPYDNTTFILDYADRDLLYSRIEKRVDIMFDLGLEDEVRRVLCRGRKISRTAAQAIGYKEFIPYFSGEKSIAEVLADIKLATRHYAKRQMIWFRRYKDAVRLVPDEFGEIKSPAQLADEAILYIVSNQ